VLLLNNALSVEQGKAGSHQKKAGRRSPMPASRRWRGRQPCVFMLWGSHAQKKAARVPGLLDGRHLVLNAPHPSPLSAYNGWFGSGHFSQANAFLKANGRGAIDWNL
jgi:uracil-DNA glycosylase